MLDWDTDEYGKAMHNEGREKEKIEIAKNLLALGISVCDVAKGTGLSVNVVEGFKNKISNLKEND